MTEKELRRAAVLGGATGARTAAAARPLAVRAGAVRRPAPGAARSLAVRAAVFIPAQRSRPPRRFEPPGPDRAADGHHRFRGRPPPAPGIR